jgi:hypothetical protein
MRRSGASCNHRRPHRPPDPSTRSIRRSPATPRPSGFAPALLLNLLKGVRVDDRRNREGASVAA